MAQEGQGQQKLTHILLNGQNYLSWAKAAYRALSGREVLEYITGETKEPTVVNPENKTEIEKKTAKNWRTKNDRIITLLVLSMEPTVADLFETADTAYELWEAVKTMYGQQNNFSHIYQLMQEIQQEKQGSRSNTEYLGALKKKKAELRTYRPLTTDLTTLQKRDEEDDIFQYLAGLNPSYEAVRSQIMTTVPLPSYSQIQNLIQQEESRRSVMGGLQITKFEEHETRGLAVKNPNFNQNRPNQTKTKKCKHCKREGHTQDRYWFLYPHLKPKTIRGANKGGDR